MGNDNTDSDASDPFDCFGDDDDDDDNVEKEEQEVLKATPDVQTATSKTKQHRDPNCGILTFHAGTEQALLMHVERELAKHGAQDENDNHDAAEVVLDAIDDFCLTRHWMMHVGNEKGKIVQSFLKECLDHHAKSVSSNQKIRLLELGTYCGYSSIRIAKILSSLGCSFEFYTVEVVEQNAQIAQQLIRHAGFNQNKDDKEDIHVLLFNPFKESLTTFLKREMFSPGKVDFLFLDHDKDLYLSDLKELEQSGWIQQGTFVAADNVVFAQIDNYRNYVNDFQQEGIVQTRLAESWLEYCDPDRDDSNEASENNNRLMKDGIELTVYLRDPPAPK